MANIRMLTARRELVEKEKLKDQGTVKARRNQESDTQDVAKKTNTSESERTAKKAKTDASLAQAEEQIAKSKMKTAAIGAAIGAIGAVVGIVATVVKLTKDSAGKDKPNNDGGGSGSGSNAKIKSSEKTSTNNTNEKKTSGNTGGNNTSEKTNNSGDINSKENKTNPNNSADKAKQQNPTAEDKKKAEPAEEKKKVNKEVKEEKAVEEEKQQEVNSNEPSEQAVPGQNTATTEGKESVQNGTPEETNNPAAVNKDDVQAPSDIKPEMTAEEKKAFKDETDSYAQLFKSLLALGTNNATESKTDMSADMSDFSKGISDTFGDIKAAIKDAKGEGPVKKPGASGTELGKRLEQRLAANVEKQNPGASASLKSSKAEIDNIKEGQLLDKAGTPGATLTADDKKKLQQMGVMGKDGKIDPTALAEAKSSNTEAGKQMGVTTLESAEARNAFATKFIEARKLELSKQGNGDGSSPKFGGLNSKFLKGLAGSIGMDIDKMKKDPEKVEEKEAKKFLEDPKNNIPEANRAELLDSITQSPAEFQANRKLDQALSKATGITDPKQLKELKDKYFEVDEKGGVALKTGEGGLLSAIGNTFNKESNIAKDIKNGNFAGGDAVKASDFLNTLENDISKGVAGQILDQVGETGKVKASDIINATGADRSKDAALTGLVVDGPNGKTVDMDALNKLKLESPDKYQKAMEALGLGDTLSNSFDKASNTDGLSDQEKQLLASVSTDGKLDMEKLNKLSPDQKKEVFGLLDTKGNAPPSQDALNTALKQPGTTINNQVLGGMLQSSGLGKNDRGRIINDAGRSNDLNSIEDKVGGAKGTGEKANWFNMMVLGLNASMPAIQFMLQQLDKMREAEDQLNEARAKKAAANALLAKLGAELKRTQGAINGDAKDLPAGGK